MNKENILLFDLETCCLDREAIKHMQPVTKAFKEPDPFVPKEFVEKEMPDFAAKYAAGSPCVQRDIDNWPNIVAADKSKHEAAESKRLEKWKSDRAKALDKHNDSVKANGKKFEEKLALNPCTSEIVGVAWMWNWELSCREVTREKDACAILSGLINKAHTVIAWNGAKFDFPYLIRRVWKHRMQDRNIPAFDLVKRGWMDKDKFVDPMLIWDCGLGYGSKLSESSMDYACKFFGLPVKPEGNVLEWQSWSTEQRNRYMTHDIKVLFQLCEIMGVIPFEEEKPFGFELDDLSKKGKRPAAAEVDPFPGEVLP